MNRQQTAEHFCEHLKLLIKQSEMSQSAFATAVGLDRSTLSQLLSDNSDRLPRAETIVAIARGTQVSVDWLLGLSQENTPGAELITNALEIEPGAGRPMDERLRRWHSEAIGYKIRYVPTSLPDLLKTEAVIRYEYQEQDIRVPELRIEQSEARLAYSRRPETDMEVCSSFQSISAFYHGENIWQKLSAQHRKEQIEWMIELIDELYPTFRWFLYDGLSKFSVPYTIFGPKRAAIYLGDMYFMFNATEQIRALIAHFDDLIRAATMQPTDISKFLQELRKQKIA